jgi:protoporphyrinogen oxidase
MSSTLAPTPARSGGAGVQPRAAVIGGGFTGLTAAYEMAKRGVAVTVLEADPEVGGLAGTFDVNGERLEKFYHHWFTNDRHVNELVEALGATGDVLYRPTRTGMYYANNFFKLSTPQDLLRFTPLPFVDRVRLGLLALRARRVNNWRELEDLTAEEWLRSLGGEKVYRVVWEPLLNGKFGADVAPEISAVWFWNKLKLRGGSRGKGGAEFLAYYKGGFAALADRVADAVRAMGGEIRLNTPATGLVVENGRVTGVETPSGVVEADAVLATQPLPLVADMLAPHVSREYDASLRRIRYLANVCLVLELDRSLSETYWLNVNDPGFPYVAVIEHTNFEPPETYGGRRIVYLSKYLPESHPMFTMSDEELYRFSLPHLKRMFPQFDERWVLGHRVWKARFSQPIVEKRYSQLIPDVKTPVEGLYLATMAQVYPEDRGTNYAIREGRAAGRLVGGALTRDTTAPSRGQPAAA